VTKDCRRFSCVEIESVRRRARFAVSQKYSHRIALSD
jgi:hypothetical protein